MSRHPTPISIAAGAKSAAPIHRFAHDGMGSRFEVLIAGEDRDYARQAAGAAFDELDRLHKELSRFNPTSDVSAVNALATGEYARVGIAAMECLKAAAGVSAGTSGAFDVTVGSLVACWRGTDGRPRTPTEEELAAARARTGMHLLDIREAEHTVGVKADGVRIDLGGIGKGYAVDQMAAILRDWSIGAALVHGGMSSVLAIGSPPGQEGWKVSLRAPWDSASVVGSIRLREIALSGSAQPIGRPHVIDPRSGRPAEENVAAWAASASGALADGLATALLVMSPEEVGPYFEGHGESAGLILAKDSGGRKAMRYGKWDAWFGPAANRRLDAR